MSQRALAKKLAIDQPQMSRILHYRIDKVSTDKLIQLLLIIEPETKIEIS